MTVPKYNEMYNDVLEILSDGKEYNHHVLADLVADKLNLSEEDKSETLKSGTLLYKSRIGWTRTYLKQAGLISSKRRNHSHITKEGLDAFNSGVYIDNDYLYKFDSFRDFLQRNRKDKKPKKQNKSPSNTNLTVKCSECGKSNIKGSLFCGFCGAKIDESKIYCPVCKTKHSSKFKFCNKCGSELVTYTQLSTNSAKSNQNLKARMYSISNDKRVRDILRDEINKDSINSVEDLKKRARILENEFKSVDELINYTNELTRNKHIIQEVTKNIKLKRMTSKEEIKEFVDDKENISSTVDLIEHLLNETSRRDIQKKIIPKIKYGSITSRGQINAEIRKFK